MVEHLIQQARRRFILNQAFAQLAFAVSVVAGGLALLLILGTGFLAWWSLAFFAAAGLGAGIYRLSRQTPDPYTTAVRLDENAHLQDALSTAFHFSHTGAIKAAEFQKLQLEQAEAAARTVRLESAVPFTIPRAFYAMAGLALLATGLVGVRYRVGHGLDLTRPITEVLFEDQNGARPKQVARVGKPGSNEWSEEAQNLLSKLGIKPTFEDDLRGEPDELNKAIEDALKQQAPQAGSEQKGGGDSRAEQGKDGAGSDEAPGGEPIDGGDKKSGDPKDSNNQAPSQGGESGKNGKPKDGADSKDSLMSKLKDAVSSMMSKSQPKPGEQSKAGEKQNQGDKKDGKKGDAGEGKPEKGSGDSDADDSDPNGDALGGQKGKGNETTASNQKQQQEGSGIGTQDGSKEIKAAEQLKAMGKISEIIGKRSQTVSGETMVEVQSGKQQLHTSYSNTNATHAETDGDVTRDEIPLALQPYIQSYFAEVHKSESAGEAKKKTGK